MDFRATFSALATAAICTAAFLCLCGCSEPPKIERGKYPLPEGAEVAQCGVGNYGGIFVLAAAQEPKTFNPLVASDAYSSQAISLMLSPLVTYDPIREEVVPALAQSWEISDGGKTYIFKLREGAKFSDGADITAEQAEQTARLFAEVCPDAEINLINGGQPVYYYLISAE